MKQKILVIVPTYNEAENITPLAEEIFAVAKTLKNFQLDLLVVDDRSPDGTADKVRQLSERYPDRVHLLLGEKAGIGRAYQRGFAYGFKKPEYQAFVMMDADFSHDPQHLPALLAAFAEGADYVIGSRYITGGRIDSGWPLRRRLQSRAANAFAALMLDMNGRVRDITGGFRVLRATALRQTRPEQIRASGNMMLVNLLHNFAKLDFRIVEVPITFRNREIGTSKMRIGDVVEFLYLTYRINPNSRVRRFIRFGLVGLSGTVVNVGVLAFLVQVWRFSPLSAAVIAIETSIVSNFFFNHIYTFRAAITSPKRSNQDSAVRLVRKLVRYNFVSLGGAGISFGVFFVLLHMGVWYILADVLAIILAMGWNYYMSVRFVWGLVDE